MHAGVSPFAIPRGIAFLMRASRAGFPLFWAPFSRFLEKVHENGDSSWLDSIRV